jgi:two-component system OmpR family response regulator
VDVLKKIKELSPTTEVIMLSGQDKIEVAVDSMKYGAYDYVIKGETAFTRIENVFNKINELQGHLLELKSMRAANKTYKAIIAGLFVLLAATLALSVFMVRKLDVSVPK